MWTFFISLVKNFTFSTIPRFKGDKGTLGITGVPLTEKSISPLREFRDFKVWLEIVKIKNFLKLCFCVLVYLLIYNTN